MTECDVCKLSLSSNLHAFGWASFNNVSVLICNHNVPCSPRKHNQLLTPHACFQHESTLHT